MEHKYVKRYKPRKRNDKPKLSLAMTPEQTIEKPKLNLAITPEPVPVSPSENTRKPTLEISSSRSVSVIGSKEGTKRTRRAKGRIEGIEQDGRIFDSEKKMWIESMMTLKNAHDKIPDLPKGINRIHATNAVYKDVKRFLNNEYRFRKRLRDWYDLPYLPKSFNQ